ncbi:MAG TPA: hypothetical protein VK138_05575 [Acidiferrobacterales bacterium]|nr:hypothetical protein [Acidiferrobacterales bacterium]
MTSPLENLSGPGKSLRKEPPDTKEFAGLKRSGQARLADAANTANSLEGRFDLAYNAAHALCLAALRWHGYRSSNRYIVFQVLPHTLGLGPEVWRVLARCHDIRNLGEYEGDLNIDQQLVTDLIAACRAVAAKLDTLPPPGSTG